MKVHHVKQNTDEWRQLRAGKVTASRLSDILKLDGTLRDSQGVQTYINELIAETLLGEPLDQQSNPWMDRGHEQEAEAAAWYAFDRDVQVSACGLITTDDERFGASPDRLVGDDGILEIKVPGAVEHVSNMRAMTSKYRAQCMGQLYVTERKWVDLVSYNPVLPSVVHRIERDEEFLANLRDALGQFFAQFDAALDVCMTYAMPLPLIRCTCMTIEGLPCGRTEGTTMIDGIATCPECAKILDEVF